MQAVNSNKERRANRVEYNVKEKKKIPEWTAGWDLHSQQVPLMDL
jgi:hypothetical protein